MLTHAEQTAQTCSHLGFMDLTCWGNCFNPRPDHFEIISHSVDLYNGMASSMKSMATYYKHTINSKHKLGLIATFWRRYATNLRCRALIWSSLFHTANGLRRGWPTMRISTGHLYRRERERDRRCGHPPNIHRISISEREANYVDIHRTSISKRVVDDTDIHRTYIS